MTKLTRPNRGIHRATALCLCLLLAGTIARVHAQAPVGMVEEPCPAPLVPPAGLLDGLVELFIEPRTLTAADMENFVRNPALAQLEQENRRRAAQDWAGLCRYSAANRAALDAAVKPRAVFMGDSITENWVVADPAFFDNGVVGRGIGGQTTPQMLVRFRADVVALHPEVVHILAGTNDVAGNTGPGTAQDYKNNIMSMVEIARANGIAVILGSIPPAASFSWRPGMNPAPRIAELNAWLRDYAAREGLELIDYHAALAGPASELNAELGNDGVHPNRKGYAVMRRLLEAKLSTDRRP